jgi:putative SOS response-associated peptidase YedK
MKAYAIATTPAELALRTNIPEPQEYTPIYQARPGMKMPMIIWRNDRPEIVTGMWGTRSSTACNTLHMSRVLKSRPWNVLIRRQRCAVPANCVIVQKNNEAFLIRLPQHRLFLLGGVYQQKNDDFHFTLLETESADILDSITKDMPVFLHNDRIQKWLTGDELDRIFHLADKAGNNYFDYFRVNEKILDPKENNRDLLVPLGMSYEQFVQRNKQIMASSFEKERLNRKHGK